MLGIIILSEWNIPASDHAHEVPRGDQAHVGQGELTGGGREHIIILNFMLKKKIQIKSVLP